MGFGCIVGLGVYFLLDLQLRWIAVPLLALFAAIFLMLVSAKRSILTIIFVLSFQVDIYLRLLHGHAGSNEGLAIPLVVVTGMILASWYVFSGAYRGFAWGGTLQIPIAAILATTILSLIVTSEKFVGLTGLIYALEYYFLYWLAFNIIRTKQDFQRIIILLLVTLGIQSLVYFVQSALGVTFDLLGNTIAEGHVPRPGGTVSANPDGFASFIMPALMIASAMALSKQFRLGNYSIFIMFMGMAAIGLSFTRAAWLGLVFGFLTIVLIGTRNRWINTRMVLLVIGIATIGILPLLPKMYDRISSDYGDGGARGTSETFKERMGLNLIAINIIKDNPIFGIGPRAYSHIFKRYVPRSMNQWLFTVHNEYLLRSAETGIVGGLAYIALLVAGVRVALRLSRGPPSLLSVCATGWLAAIFILIWMMLWTPWIGFSYNAMFWFMLGLMDGAQRLVNFEKSSAPGVWSNNKRYRSQGSPS